MDFNNIPAKIKRVLLDPLIFFDSLKQEIGIKSAFTYLLVLSLFSAVMGLIIGQFFQDYYYDLIAKIYGFSFPKPKYTSYSLISITFLGYTVRLLGSFIFAGILHVWILIFGGKASYSKTYQVYVYSRTPAFIFGWIPFFSFFTWIYDLILLILGTQKIHNISKTKSILMYVIPLILIGLFLLGFLFFLLSLIKSYPDMFQNLTSAKT